MIRRLILLATLSVLVGVFVLSASASAESASRPSKATTQASISSTAAAKTVSSTSAARQVISGKRWTDGLRFWLRSFLGLPPIPSESKPPDYSEPLRSVGDQGSANNWTGKPMVPDIAKDHGGDSVDF